jgi:hypothetical protein
VAPPAAHNRDAENIITAAAAKYEILDPMIP